MSVISYDIIQGGVIIDTIQMPSTVDEAFVTQKYGEVHELDIKSFHICKLRWLSNNK